ncbi:Wzz/FepE/Etk N-terminal domain-containing protein [Sandarakinorhabdus sp.]|uniref:Wzz/FepE/Etk N-terminal domain-containing protein n=1 Tax=Sandarakinorhabdus sp. TaxID=1916663 RepID=UPI00286E12DF|nr:Wzz/FepE/Etk N-terminal domain-containing protein [Sandarakinorhabdus sp.]
MSIVQFLRILIARRWIILATLITCVVVATAVARILPPRYPARARVLMDSFKPDPVTGSMIQTSALRTFTRTQIELIKDYRVAGDVVDKLGLLNSPDLVAAFQSETGGAGDMRRWVAERITENTNVGLVENSNILEITYEASNPEIAKRTVNALRDSYIDNSLRFRTDSAGRTADWYLEQADRAKRVLEDAEAAKTKYETDNGIVITAGGEAETVKLSGLQSALVAARSGEGAQQFAATTRANESPVVDQLKIQLANMNDAIEQSAERLGTQHPTYLAMLTRRDQLQVQVRREEASARAAGSRQLGSSRQSVAQLESAYEAQRAKVFAMKDKLDKDAALMREVELRRAQYEQAAKRTAELRLESNINDSGLIVLGDARAQASPSFPNWTQIVSLSVGLGLGMGIVLGLFVELLNRRVRGAEDLRTSARVPVFAIIGETPRPAWRTALRRLLSRRSETAASWQPAQ